MQLFSNPVQDNIKLVLTGINGKLDLYLNDITGKTIYKNQVQNQNGLLTIPVNLQRGVYILVARNNNEKKSLKLVKE